MAEVRYYVNDDTKGGVLPLQVLAALERGDGILCGLVFSYPDGGWPRCTWLEVIEEADLARMGYHPVPALWARLRALPLAAFLEALEAV